MTDHHLTDLLERVAERTDVGAAPLAAIRQGVRRRRRRNGVLGGAGLTAAVVAATVAVPVLSNPGHDVTPPGPATSQSTQSPVPSPPRQIDLEGKWIVIALVGRDGRPALPQHRPNRARLTFHDGRLGGTTGCNDLFGRYVQRGVTLRFPSRSLGSTLVGCSWEPPLVSRLLDVRSVAHDQGGTYLEDANGKVVVALVRPDAP
jgi:heat shock protein HslJ